MIPACNRYVNVIEKVVKIMSCYKEIVLQLDFLWANTILNNYINTLLNILIRDKVNIDFFAKYRGANCPVCN